MANIVQRAVAWAAQAVGAITDPMDPRLWGVAIASAASGQTVTSDSGLQLDVVQSVLGRLGGTMSTLPFMVYERTGPNPADRKEARDHPLFKILNQQPNARQTAQEFRDEQERHLAWWRNAYALIQPAEDGSPIGELIPIHPGRKIKIERASDGFVYYTFRRLAPAFGQDTYREDEIFHIRKAPLTENGLEGIPVFQSSRDTIGRAQAVEQFASLFFANGGSGGGVIQHPGKFQSKEDQALFLETWRSGGSGLNRHRDRLALFGVTYQPFSVNNNESQFIETRTQMGYSLARLWNMPPHMAGILDKATFTNIEQQGTEYVVHCISSDTCAWEQACWRDLLVGEDQDRFFVEFNVSGLLRGDFKTRWGGYAQGRQWGWLSVNDVRRLEGLAPIGPEGDVYVVPLNMVPAGEDDTPGADGPDDNPVKDPAQPPAEAE